MHRNLKHPKHPMQRLLTDAYGVVHFEPNAIVRFLLDAGPFDMNTIARMEFSDGDRDQFAQLIGYSLDAYGELPYVSVDSHGMAVEHSSGGDPRDAQITYLLRELGRLREALREPVARLFGVHVDDLGAKS